jgi:hypothetical protein
VTKIKNPPNGSWEMVQVLSTKTSPQNLAPPAKYQTLPRYQCWNLEGLLAKDLNMQLERTGRVVMTARQVARGHTQDFAVGAELFGSVCRKDLNYLPTAAGRISFF